MSFISLRITGSQPRSQVTSGSQPSGIRAVTCCHSFARSSSPGVDREVSCGLGFMSLKSTPRIPGRKAAYTIRMRLALALLVLLPFQDPPPKAARSVHLWWSAPEGTDFYNEARIQESTPGSYFMACGWNTGYFGV